jgi:hypothetical protein
MVVHTCNPSYSGGGDERITVQSQTGENQKQINKKREREERERDTKGMARAVESFYLALNSIPKKGRGTVIAGDERDTTKCKCVWGQTLKPKRTLMEKAINYK